MRFVFAILSFCIAQFTGTPLFAQFFDSLDLSIGIKATLSTKDYQPLWTESLEFGTISNQKSDISTHVLISNVHLFNIPERQTETKTTMKYNFYLSYGIDVYNNNHFQKTFFKEAYLKTGYKSLEIRAGQFVDVVGGVNSNLSSGSFAVSGNALPIPKIGLAVTEYTDVPLTKGFLQFKGQFSHGWLGQTNYVKGAFLHEKSFYVKADKNAFSIYGGLSHFANWAGTHPNGKAPNRFKDYLRIIIGASGDAEDPIYHQGPIDIANAVGNHMIVSDIGIEIILKKSSLKLYTQTIFEKGKGDSSNTNKRDELIALNILGKDRLLGFSWESQRQRLVQELLIEGIYTKQQGGPIIYNGRFNYYNNATYATGWEYKDQIIGTPLFVSRNEAAHYKLDPNSTRGWNIVSNRIMGLHAGIKGSINAKLNYRTLFTCLKHYGNYYNDALFAPNKKQSHLLFEISYQLNPKLFLSPAFALDRGELSTNTGGRLAMEWKLK